MRCLFIFETFYCFKGKLKGLMIFRDEELIFEEKINIVEKITIVIKLL